MENRISYSYIDILVVNCCFRLCLYNSLSLSLPFSLSFSYRHSWYIRTSTTIYNKQFIYSFVFICVLRVCARARRAFVHIRDRSDRQTEVGRDRRLRTGLSNSVCSWTLNPMQSGLEVRPSGLALCPPNTCPPSLHHGHPIHYSTVCVLCCVLVKRLYARVRQYKWEVISVLHCFPEYELARVIFLLFNITEYCRGQLITAILWNHV